MVDSDTIGVELGGRAARVPLIGIDTPETRSPNDPVECYGAEATDHTTGMLDGRTVYLQRDVSNTDRFDRLLRYVWFLCKCDGRAYLANELLVLRGYAVVTTFPPDIAYVERFTAAQDQAQAALAGLWGRVEAPTRR